MTTRLALFLCFIMPPAVAQPPAVPSPDMPISVQLINSAAPDCLARPQAFVQTVEDRLRTRGLQVVPDGPLRLVLSVQGRQMDGTCRMGLSSSLYHGPETGTVDFGGFRLERPGVAPNLTQPLLSNWGVAMADIAVNILDAVSEAGRPLTPSELMATYGPAFALGR